MCVRAHEREKEERERETERGRERSRPARVDSLFLHLDGLGVFLGERKKVIQSTPGPPLVGGVWSCRWFWS